MDHSKKRTKEESIENGRRRYESVLKFQKIVDRFDDLAYAMDSVTQLTKRRKTSKNPSGSGGSNSATVVDEAAQRYALEQIISKHLSDLQSNQPPESSSSPKDLKDEAISALHPEMPSK